LAKSASSAPLPCDVCGLATLRTALVSGVAASLLAGLASSADAAPRRSFFFSPYGWYGGYYGYPSYAPSRRERVAPTRRERIEPTKEASFGEMPKGPLQIVVSIDEQKVTLFSNGVRVAQGPVSTGVPGHPTPTGVFSIIEKDRYHRSNLYSAAPMPYMQRITWSGVALHEGVLPGYPASHGCIRMSQDFAQKLWPITKLGVRVIVARRDLAPVDFAHPKLFVPKPKPSEPQVARNAATDGRSLDPAMVVAEATPTDAAREAIKTVPDVMPAVAEPRPAGAAPGDDNAVKPAPSDDSAKPAAPPFRRVDQPVKRSGQVAVFVSRKEMKLFVRQGMVPLFDTPVAIDEPDRPLGTHVFTAMDSTADSAGMRWNLMTVATDPSPPVEPQESRRRSREPPWGVVHKPAAHKPAVALKPASTASQALDRIQMPKEAVDRIGELLIAGSSLVISDEGLGRETGRHTEFIVVTR
jgi:lipoprotein-anchoring transpeptidase ErfK/SrfK